MADSQSYPKALRIRATPGLIAQYKARGLRNQLYGRIVAEGTECKVTRDELLELIKDAVEQRDLNRGPIKWVYTHFLGHLQEVQRAAAEVRVSEPKHYTFRPGSQSVCGLTLAAVEAWEATGREGELRIEPRTSDIRQVTCRACRREIASIVKQWSHDPVDGTLGKDST
jgi:hypothetical protein